MKNLLLMFCIIFLATSPAYAGDESANSFLVNSLEPIAVPVWSNRPIGTVNNAGLVVDVVMIQSVGTGVLTVCYALVERAGDVTQAGERICDQNLVRFQALDLRSGNTIRVLNIPASEIEDGEYTVYVQVERSGFALPRRSSTSTFVGEESKERRMNTFPYNVVRIELVEGKLQFADSGCVLVGFGNKCFSSLEVKVLTKNGDDTSHPFSMERFPPELLEPVFQGMTPDGRILYSLDRNFCPPQRQGKETKPVIVVKNVSFSLRGTPMDEAVTVPGFCGIPGLGE